MNLMKTRKKLSVSWLKLVVSAKVVTALMTLSEDNAHSINTMGIGI